jgi:hypothetical protein
MMANVCICVKEKEIVRRGEGRRTEKKRRGEWGGEMK